MSETAGAGQGGDTGDNLELTFVGNATVLLRFGGFTILTDPNFLHRGERAYLGYGLSSRRLKDPALFVDQLPAVDAVVLSHLHGDHWDRRARRGLARDVPIVTTPHASRRLQGIHGFRRAVGLSTWEHHVLSRDESMVRITAVPGQHARGMVKRLLPPVMGSLTDFLDDGGRVRFRLYVTGDTLMFDGLAAIVERYPDIDAAVIHLGGTRLPGGLIVTMDGAQGAQLVDLVRPGRAVPVHFDDYGVFTSGLEDFRRELNLRGLGDRVHAADRGATIRLPARGNPRAD